MGMLREILPTVLDTKTKNILAEERETARAVANDVTGTMAVGVWDFLLPPLFIINLLRHQRSKEAFTLNFMFTKKLALQAAGNMLRSGLTEDESMAEVEQRTTSILSADRKGVYSEKVRLKQMLEVRLLIDHYQKLIASEGKTYPDMVKAAYADRASFESFLRRLTAAEKEVNRSALQLAGKNPEAKDFVARMEEAVKQVRRRDLDNYFPPPE
jgi:hypothetical protein